MPDAEHRGNLHAAIPRDLPEELTEVLAAGSGPVRIERIVSRGHRSADGCWYDQAESEWVMLVAGSAVLRLDAPDGETADLAPGDWVHLPAHRRHRVESTDAEADTVWLAVFFGK